MAEASKEADEMITLVSQEGEKFTVHKRVAQMSVLVKNLTEDATSNEAVPIPDVKAAVLGRVLEFFHHHLDNALPAIEKPLRNANLSECGVPEWDVKFINLPQEQLFELILAANYLDVRSLLDLSCAKVASMVKGKAPDEIRKTFGVKSDFSPEEEAQIKEEHKWCEEL